MKNFNWLIFCALVLFSVGMGCSTITPNQMAPNQTADSSGGGHYCFEEDVEMDLCDLSK
jgi:hypothetical protein